MGNQGLRKCRKVTYEGKTYARQVTYVQVWATDNSSYYGTLLVVVIFFEKGVAAQPRSSYQRRDGAERKVWAV